jgi:uncharacterized protein involved in exopolysaccharide biosynthesis
VELPASTGGELGDFTSALRRQRWVLVLVAAVVAVAGTVLVVRRPATWTSTASVLVPESSDGAGARGDSLVDLSTQRQVLRSDTVAATARERLAGEDVGLAEADPEDLAARVDVEVPVDTRVLRLTARGDDAQQARAVARAFVSAYRDISYLNAVADRNSLSDVVEGELADAEASLDDANDALGNAALRLGGRARGPVPALGRDRPHHLAPGPPQRALGHPAAAGAGADTRRRGDDH